MQTRKFLEALFPSLTGEGTYIEQRAFRGGKPTVDFAPEVRGAIAFFKRIRPTHDAYFGIATRSRSGHGGKADLASSRALWADVDQPDAAARLRESGLPRPSIIIATGTPGHVQAYWLLKQMQDLRSPDDVAPFESYLRGIRDACGGDNTVDASRLFRMPGSLNWKHDPPRCVEVVRFCPEFRYTLDDFPRGELVRSDAAELEAVEPRPGIFIPGWVQVILDQGYEAGDCRPDPTTGEIDESAQDWKIVKRLRERGLTAEETLWYVTNAPAIGRRKRHWADYWRRTVTKAYQGVQPK
ncbi:MAG TPA: hypothetical protein VH701_01255 [Vicinamibacterales bacterium]